MKNVKWIVFLLTLSVIVEGQKIHTIGEIDHQEIFNSVVEDLPEPKCMYMTDENEITIHSKDGTMFRWVDFKKKIKLGKSHTECSNPTNFVMKDNILRMSDGRVVLEKKSIIYQTVQNEKVEVLVLTGSEKTRTGFVVYKLAESKENVGQLFSFDLIRLNDESNIIPQNLKMFGNKVFTIDVHSKSGNIAIASKIDFLRWRLTVLKPTLTLDDAIDNIFNKGDKKTEKPSRPIDPNHGKSLLVDGKIMNKYDALSISKNYEIMFNRIKTQIKSMAKSYVNLSTRCNKMRNMLKQKSSSEGLIVIDKNVELSDIEKKIAEHFNWLKAEMEKKTKILENTCRNF